ncbi:hypothetical protein BU15DRAFT_81678 [Melanogaster broomeanus]|nr:hypothetical protein BU15DRAFT_81678 [Melanogaster broomeanus]
MRMGDADDRKSLKKRDLVALVTRQIDKWPYPTFQPATTTAELLRSLLLNPSFGSRRRSQTTPAFKFTVEVMEMTMQQPKLHPHLVKELRTKSMMARRTSKSRWYVHRVFQPVPGADMPGPHLPALDCCDETEQSCEATNPLVDPAEGQDTQREGSDQPRGVTSYYDVRVYVADFRYSASQPVRTSCIVSLPEVESASCKADEWKVSTVELLQQLQVSSAAIDDSGPLRLSCPDPLDAQYRWCFLTTGPGETILDTAPETLTLTVADDQQDNHRVQIIVDQVRQPAPPLLPVPQQSTDSHPVSSTRPTVSRTSDPEGTVEQYSG